MKKLSLGLALGLALFAGPSALSQPAIVGPSNAILCNNAAILAVGSTGLTKIITGVAGKAIFICGWHITNTGATGTLAISIGTGANCGSNTVAVVPAINVTSSAPSSDHIDYATIQTPLAGVAGTPYDLCVNPSVATIMTLVWYSQF
jgi:hypothetical protein